MDTLERFEVGIVSFFLLLLFIFVAGSIEGGYIAKEFGAIAMCAGIAMVFIAEAFKK